MGKMFYVVAIALVVACVAWAWISVRKYSARKRMEEERAAAVIAEAASAMRKARPPTAKT